MAPPDSVDADATRARAGSPGSPDATRIGGHSHAGGDTAPRDRAETTRDSTDFATDDEPGDPPRLGRYILAGELARGGMGVVYKAHDPAFDREVAVKILADRLRDNPASVARFLEEARVTAQLQHPAIPPVHDIGEVDGLPYLAMKLIKGSTLHALLAERSGPSEDSAKFLGIFENICLGVAYAHSRGVLHRDLKPLNIMVGAFGEVQVMDWGLAKHIGRADHSVGPAPEAVQSLRAAEVELTEYGRAIGTPAFMPPEQARGELERIDRRADVFSLGAILSLILTGRPLYAGKTGAAILESAAAADLAGAHERLEASGADADAIALVKSCLAADPADRPADAGALVGRLIELRTRADERAKKAELDWNRGRIFTEERKRQTRLKRLLLTGVGAFLLVASGVLAWVFVDRANRETAAVGRQLAEAEEKNLVRDEASGKVADNAIRVAYRYSDAWQIEEAQQTIADARDTLGPDAPAAAREKLDAARRELEFAARLDGIRTANGVDLSKRDAAFQRYLLKEYTAAFQSYGCDLWNGDKEALTRRMRESPIRAHLQAALDLWMFAEQQPLMRAFLWTFATALGTETWRTKVATSWRTSQAMAQMYAATPVDQRTPAFYTFVGMHLEIGDWNGQGLAVFDEALERFPADPMLRFSVAQLHYYKGKFPAAISQYRVCLALRPNFASAWRGLERCYQQIKRPADAAAAKAKAEALEARR